MLIAAVRTPIKKFHTKKIPPAKKAPRKEADIDLEDEFISTPPHQWILRQVMCILTCFVAGYVKCTIY